MTKSSIRNAAAEKAPGTYRKTTRRKTARKVGAGKAHKTDRKTASKIAAEKARGTYRKTAARFEEFAYDAQMPESMRALAEKSVAQTRELYVHSLEAVLESWERFVVAAGQGTVALNRKAIDIARRNINTSFGLAERLAGAKNLAEAMELQTSYWRNQVGELAAQAGEMRKLSTKVTADVTAPIKAQVSRGMKGLHTPA
jgi:phasin family protein